MEKFEAVWAELMEYLTKIMDFLCILFGVGGEEE